MIVFQDQQREINYIDGTAYLYSFNNTEDDNEQKESINNHIADIRIKNEKDATINKLRQKSCNYLFLGNELIAGGYGFNSFNAEMVLSEWKKGTLGFPFMNMKGL